MKRRATMIVPILGAAVLLAGGVALAESPQRAEEVAPASAECGPEAVEQKSGDDGCYCLDIWDPVCGSDGNTYSNACYADCAGVTVVSEGACASFASLNSCICPDVYDPVCGVNGVTYSNSCRAGCAGVEIAHDGACGETF